MPEPYRTLLGFDHGGRHIGVAVGQELTGATRPVCTLNAQAGEPNWAEVQRLLSEWRPELLIVGVPRHADGSASHSTLAAIAFSEQLQQQTDKPVLTVDEHLSSHEAQHRLNHKPSDPTQRRSTRQGKTQIHEAAAAVILETWLRQTASSPLPG